MQKYRYKVAGIVLFNPDISRLEENIAAISKQVEKVVLVDNGSENIEIVESIYGDKKNILIVKNNVNLGIAAALNIIIQTAQSLNYEWVLLLDQDSVTPPDLMDGYSKFLGFDKIAVICPVINDRNDHGITSNTHLREEYTLVKECITSGSLVNCSICESLNYFNEEMFIDYVDLDYSKRVYLAGYSILQVNNVDLIHEIGKKTYHKFLFFKITTFNHSAFRKYYITRNTLYYAKKYNDESLLKAYLKIVKRLLIVLIFEKEKNSKVKAMFKGIIDSKKIS